MTTDIDICNVAITKIAANTFSQWGLGTVEERVAKSLYPIIKEELLSDHFWNFATRRRSLNKNSETPLNERWKYSFTLPSDFIKLITVTQFTDIQIDYDLEGDLVYANDDRIMLSYISNVDESTFTAPFKSALIARLTYEFGDSIKRESATRKQERWAEYKNKLKDAKRVDAQERIPTPLISDDNSQLLRARRGA